MIFAENLLRKGVYMQQNPTNIAKSTKLCSREGPLLSSTEKYAFHQTLSEENSL